jgi:hypothetical protein
LSDGDIVQWSNAQIQIVNLLLLTQEDNTRLEDLFAVARQLEAITDPGQANGLRRARDGRMRDWLNRLVRDQTHWEELRLTLHRNLEPELGQLETAYDNAWSRFEQHAFFVALRDWAHGRHALFNQTHAGANSLAITRGAQNLSFRQNLARHVNNNNRPHLQLYLPAFEAAGEVQTAGLYRDAYRRLISASAKCGDVPHLAPYNLMVSLRRIHRSMLGKLANVRCILTAMIVQGVDGRRHSSPAMGAQPGVTTPVGRLSTVQAVRNLRREILRRHLSTIIWPAAERAHDFPYYLRNPQWINIQPDAEWSTLLSPGMRHSLDSVGTNEVDESDLDWLANLYFTYLLRGFVTNALIMPPQRPNPAVNRHPAPATSGRPQTPESRWAALIHIIGLLYPRFELAGICDTGAHDLIAPLGTYSGHGNSSYDIDRQQGTNVRAVRPPWLWLNSDVLGENAPVDPGIYVASSVGTRIINVSAEREFETKTESAIFGRRNQFNGLWNAAMAGLRNPNADPNIPPSVARLLAGYENPVHQFFMVQLWPHRLRVTGANTALAGRTNNNNAQPIEAVPPDELSAGARNRLRRLVNGPDSAMFFFGLFDLNPIDSNVELQRLHLIQQHAWRSLESVFTSGGRQFAALWRLLSQMPAPASDRTPPRTAHPSSNWLIRALDQRHIPLEIAAADWLNTPRSLSNAQRVLMDASREFERRLTAVVEADPLSAATSATAASQQLQSASFTFYTWLAGRVGMTGPVASGSDLQRERPIPTIDSNGELRGTNPGTADTGGSQLNMVYQYVRVADLDGRPVSGQQRVFLNILYSHLSSTRMVNGAGNLGDETAPSIGEVGMTGNPMGPHVHMQLELYSQDPLQRRPVRQQVAPIAVFSPAEIFLPISELRLPGHGNHLPYHDIAITADPVRR